MPPPALTPPTNVCQAKAVAGMIGSLFGGPPTFSATPGCTCQVCHAITVAKEMHAAAPVLSPGMFTQENVGTLLTRFANYQPPAPPPPAIRAPKAQQLRKGADGVYR